VTDAVGRAAVTTWTPLRRPVFRALWIAQFAANTGTWAQTVGAQWLMGDLGGGSLAVALVQTATTLPVFLLVVPAGALGDIVDRRRLLLCGTAVMFAGAAALALLTATGAMTPALVLALTAAVGAGAALSLPTFAAIQPELVPREAIPQAALLNGANLNVARALGPALGGALIGVAGPEATFALSAVSLLAVVAVLVGWDRQPDDRPLGAERVRPAIVTGIRYVRSSPAFATVVARTLLFILFASALWSLVPDVARGPLGLGAGGYGLLLGAIGVGAVAGAFTLPLVRGRLEPNRVVVAGTLAYSAAMVVVGLGRSPAPVALALVIAGLGWIAVMSSLSACAQLVVPGWARARALAFYTLTFMGGQAVGGALWGAVAETAGLQAAFAVAAAGGVLATTLGARRLALPKAGDVRRARHWPEPAVVLDIDDDAGPVLVTVEWRVERDPAGYMEAMRALGRARRRTGAAEWGLFQDIADPAVFLEAFTVDTWHEHLRQHLERQTAGDERLEAQARRYVVAASPRQIRHLVWAYRRGP
jgi:MFS family permease